MKIFQPLSRLFLCVWLLLGACVAQAKHHPYSHGLASELAGFILENNEKVKPTQAKLYVWQAYQSAGKWNVDPLLLLSMMKVESNYRERVTNGYGAVGLLQVVPRYHPEKVKGKNLLHYRDNIEVGARILDEYLKQNQENFKKALFKYSGGSKSYYHKVRKHYQVLRAKLFYYKLKQDLPIIASYILEQPRKYTQSIQGYQKALQLAQL